MTYLIIIAWIVLGIHSAWYFVRKYTLNDDVTYREIDMIALCVLVPVVTHLATYFVYGKTKDKNSPVIFKRRT